MKTRAIATAAVLGCLVLLVLLAGESAAQTTPLRVLASNGMRAVIEELRPGIERQVGRPLNVEFNTSAAIRKRIESGEAFDVVVLTSEIIADFAKAGKIDPATRGELGRSGIGIGARPGAARRDIRTPEALKTMLLNAKSMTWVEVGASRVHIDKMMDGLGIAADVKPKTILTQGVDQSLAGVTEGKADIIITLISEILPAKGVELIGPLPAKFQNYVRFAAGVSAAARVPAAAALLVKLLGAPSASRTYQVKGMELPVQIDIPSSRPPVK